MTQSSIAAVWMFLLAGGGAAAGDPAGEPDNAARVVLLDRALRAHPVAFIGLDDRGVTYTDASGLVRTEPLSEYVAMVADPEPSLGGSRTGAVIELTDGQSLLGALLPGGDDETVRWSHPLLGEMAVPLDRVRRVRLGEPARPASGEATTDDLVVLANGDVLSGFVESIGESIVLEVGGQARELALEVVAEVRLANPAGTPGGTVLWLSDGSVVAVGSMRTTRLGEVEVRPVLQEEAAAGTDPGSVGWSMPIDPGGVFAVAFDASRLAPLASIPAAEQRPVGERRWAEPVSAGASELALLGAADLVVPGPMVAEWALPAGAERLAMEVELPPEMWTWGDCELVFAATGPASAAARELARVRLNRDQPLASINVALGGAARVRMTLEPGAYGPIQDRVVLRRPLVLIGENAPGS